MRCGAPDRSGYRRTDIINKPFKFWDKIRRLRVNILVDWKDGILEAKEGLAAVLQDFPAVISLEVRLDSLDSRTCAMSGLERKVTQACEAWQNASGRLTRSIIVRSPELVDCLPACTCKNLAEASSCDQ